MKYKYILDALITDELYSPAKIAQFALDNNMLPIQKSDKKLPRIEFEKFLKIDYQRVRICMSRFANNHNLHSKIDGQVKLKGQDYASAWFGYRWHDAMYF